MDGTYIRKIILSSCLFFFLEKGFSQPFVDLINTSYQSLSTTYKDSAGNPNKTENYFLNMTIPIKIDSQNTIIARFYGERLITHYNGYVATSALPAYVSTESNLYSALLPIGLQHETKSKKWKFLGLAMPKLSSDFRDKVNSYDFQMGGYGMATYSKSNNFKVKFGLFYNREFFGDFFIPIFAIDWKVNSWFQMYGALPNNYRLEFAPWRKHIYTGLAFKSYTRSYRLNSAASHDYVRNNEMQVKLFLEVYLAKRFVLFGEFGRTIGYSPLAYKFNTKRDQALIYPQYTPIKDALFFNVGLAYRIRFDF